MFGHVWRFSCLVPILRLYLFPYLVFQILNQELVEFLWFFASFYFSWFNYLQLIQLEIYSVMHFIDIFIDIGYSSIWFIDWWDTQTLPGKYKALHHGDFISDVISFQSWSQFRSISSMCRSGSMRECSKIILKFSKGSSELQQNDWLLNISENSKIQCWHLKYQTIWRNKIEPPNNIRFRMS